MCSVESEQQLEDKLLAQLKTLAFMQVKQIANTADLRAILSQFPDDFMADGREQPTQQKEREAVFTPRDYFGAARISKQEVDSYLQASREGWN